LARRVASGYWAMMVELPGSLERSTLGDVLGALHRDRVTGTLRLHEMNGGREQVHVIAWRDGLIHHVETSRPRRAVGAPSRPKASVCWATEGPAGTELLERLEALFEITRARLSFRVMGSHSPPASRPLGPREFLHGRRRSRDATARTREPAASKSQAPTPPPESPRMRALRTLGLQGEPGADAVRAAFRQLARVWHPDRHPTANEHMRAALCQRFAQITVAYEQLIGGR
jgi:hypothetical protein